jgi:NAD+-dependent protein deacetylase sirtuin 4
MSVGIPPTAEPEALAPLLDLLRDRRIVVLAGAGCSTESGIPDYRGPEAISRPRRPIQYQDFVRSDAARVRYWARSAVGWPRFSASRPNDGHRALAELERAGSVRGIITQNVDGLHHAAGSRSVIELHGSLSNVRCLRCGDVVPRDVVQQRLVALNPHWFHGASRRAERGEVEVAPDGDAEIFAEALRSFRIPECTRCGGVLKPDVVFFGENVPRERVDQAWSLFDSAEVLLVVGSSLTVYSGRRFIYRASEIGLPIGIVNIGPTRADATATAKVEGRLGEVLPRLASGILAMRDAGDLTPFPEQA